VTDKQVNITLRPVTRDDYDFLWALLVDTLRPYVEATWGWDEAYQRARFRDHFDPACQDIVLADGVAVGVFRVERREDSIFLSNIGITPAYQGRGIGTKLIQDLLEKATARGVPVELRVLKVNPARGLYERLGFAVIEEFETHWQMRWEPPSHG
jgi:ribosomal protein S18 acetylase RimI-like enzyme